LTCNSDQINDYMADGINYQFTEAEWQKYMRMVGEDKGENQPISYESHPGTSETIDNNESLSLRQKTDSAADTVQCEHGYGKMINDYMKGNGV